MGACLRVLCALVEGPLGPCLAAPVAGPPVGAATYQPMRRVLSELSRASAILARVSPQEVWIAVWGRLPRADRAASRPAVPASRPVSLRRVTARRAAGGAVSARRGGANSGSPATGGPVEVPPCAVRGAPHPCSSAGQALETWSLGWRRACPVG